MKEKAQTLMIGWDLRERLIPWRFSSIYHSLHPSVPRAEPWELQSTVCLNNNFSRLGPTWSLSQSVPQTKLLVLFEVTLSNGSIVYE